MYIIKITDKSCKVILSKKDLNKYGSNIFDDKEASSDFFNDVLSLLPHSEEKRIIAHADFFEDKFGGGELFILFGHEDKPSKQNVFVFVSESIEEIIRVSHALSSDSYIAESRLILNEEKYHLVLKTAGFAPYLKERLGDYGNCKRAADIDLWTLEEHGKILIENRAIEKLLEIFVTR